MKRFMILATAIISMLQSNTVVAIDNAALIGSWTLVERAKDADGKLCPFVGEQIRFTPDGKMISPNMPMPFSYKANPAKAEAEAAVSRRPELKGKDILLAIPGNMPGDWTKAPIAYGVSLKGNQLTMIVPGYTPARYKKQK